MDQEKLIELLKRCGCEVTVHSGRCSIIRGGFYSIKPTFEAALLDYIETLHATEKQLKQWKDTWMPTVVDWSEHNG